MVLQRLRLFGSMACLLAWLGASPAGLHAADKTKIDEESPTAVMPEDPKTKSYLRRAETAIKDKDWNQALNLLDKVVREAGDAVVGFRKGTLEQLNTDADTVQFHWWTFISTRERVAKLKGELPDDAKELGTVTAEPQAQNLLKSAIETGEPELLLAVTENYSTTSSADNALYVLGEWNLLKEDFATAASCYRRILAYKDSDLDTPSIRWRLCQALDSAGDAKGAAAELESLVQGGKWPATARPIALEQIATTWLAKLKAKAAAGGSTGAVASSAATMMGDAAHTNFVKDVPLMGDRMLTMGYDVAFVDNIYTTQIAEREGPANIYPVVRDEIIYLTDGRRIRAFGLINPESKKPYWAQPSTEDRRALDANKNEHCRTLTVSDTSVYAVMGSSADQTVQADWQGTRFGFEKTYLNGYERPQGHPVMYGRIKWSTFGRDDMVNSEADKKFLDNLHIPAAPVYVDGMLYCSAVGLDDEHGVYALAFNAENGKLRWRRKLCAGSIFLGVNRAIDLGSQVGVSAGKVYVLTPMGTLACIEAITGSVKWETAWQQNLQMQKMNNWNGQQRFPEDVPYPQPPIIFKDRVMIMPQDCPWLIAFDADTGEPKWIRDRREDHADLHYLYGIATTETTVRRKGVKYVEQVGILIAAGKKLTAYNVSNGKAIWERELTGYDKAMGIGVVTESFVLVPTRTHLVPVRVADGTIPAENDQTATWHPYKWENPKTQAGHVLVSNGVIITASSNAFSVYYIKTDRQRQLLEKMKVDGETPELWMQIADLDDRTHDYAKALETLATARTLATAWAALPENDPKAAIGKQALEETARRMAQVNFKFGMQSLQPVQADDDKIAAGAKDGLMDGAEKIKLAATALVCFDRSLASLQTLAKPPADSSAQSLWGRARALETVAAGDKKAAAAIQAYQELLTRFGTIKYAFGTDGQRDVEAYVFGRDKIRELILKYGRAEYDAIEQQAVKIYNEEYAKKPEARDLARLQRLLNDFPNANASGDVLLLLAEVTSQKEGALKAVRYLHLFLATNGDNPKAAQVQYNLFSLYRQSKMAGAAKSMVMELKRRYAERKIQVDGKEVEVAVLVEQLFKLPELQPAPSIASRKKLTVTPVEGWPLTLPRPGQLYPLVADGEPPAGCEKFIYVHDGRDVYCVDGITGARRFSHKAYVMQQRSMQAAFAGNALVTVTGENTVSGENAAGSDEKPWEYEFTVKGEKRNATMLLGSDTLALVVDRRTVSMAGLEPTSGREMWTRNNFRGTMGLMPPRIVENRVIVTTFDDGDCTVNILDCATGENLSAPVKLESRGIRITAVSGTTLVAQDAQNNVIGFELFSGKQLWSTPLPGPVMTLPDRWPPTYTPMLTCTDKQVIAIRDGGVHILSLADGKPVGAGDAKFIDLKGVPIAVTLEGDQLFVSTMDRANAARPNLTAISISTAAIQWKTPCAQQPLFSATQITRDHVVITANDFNNGNTFMVNLVNRTTGKIVYSNKLHNMFPMCLATADRAFLFADQTRVRGYVCVDPEEIKQQVVSTEKAWKADEKNITLLLAHLDALSLDGQGERGFDLLAQAFQKGQVNEENWQNCASKLEALRRSVLEKHKYKFLVQKTAKPPTLDGDIKEWEDAVWFDFKDLRYIYHDTFDKTLAKAFWKVPEDLSCRTAMRWDKDNLYICWEVIDDIHEQTKSGLSIWDGDSVQFAIDPTMDGGTSWRQGDTEDTIAIDSTNGTCMAAIDYSPTQKTPEFKGLRDKDKKKTYYEMSIPLSDVQLDAKDGGRFGYTFIVNDRDDDKSSINKGLAPAPGIWNPKFPGMYAVAYFGEEGQKELNQKQKDDQPTADTKDEPNQ